MYFLGIISAVFALALPVWADESLDSSVDWSALQDRLNETENPAANACSEFFKTIQNVDQVSQEELSVEIAANRSFEEETLHQIFDTWPARNAIAQELFDYGRAKESGDSTVPLEYPHIFNSYQFLQSIQSQSLDSPLGVEFGTLVDQMIERIGKSVPAPLSDLAKLGMKPLTGGGFLGLPIFVHQYNQEQADAWNALMATPEGKAKLRIALFYKFYRPQGPHFNKKIDRQVDRLIAAVKAEKSRIRVGQVFEKAKAGLAILAIGTGGLATINVAASYIKSLPTPTVMIPYYSRQLETPYPKSAILSDRLPKLVEIPAAPNRIVAVHQFDASYRRTMGVSDFIKLLIETKMSTAAREPEVEYFIRGNLDGLSAAEIHQLLLLVHDQKLKDELVLNFATRLRGPLKADDEKMLIEAVSGEAQQKLKALFNSPEYLKTPFLDADEDTKRYFRIDTNLLAKVKVSISFPYDAVKGWEITNGRWLKDGVDAGKERPARFSKEMETLAASVRSAAADPVLNPFRGKFSQRYGIDELRVRVVVGPSDTETGRFSIERIELVDGTIATGEGQLIFRVRDLPANTIDSSQLGNIFKLGARDVAIYGGYRFGSPVTSRFVDLR